MDLVISDVVAHTSTAPHLMFGCGWAAPYLSLTPHILACMSNSFSLTPSMVFVWLLGFVCLLFPDGRHRLHLSSFQVPRAIFTALAEELILFPLVGLYDRPFIHNNWKQLSLPVCTGGSKSKPISNLSPALNSITMCCHAADSQKRGPVCFSKEKWYCPCRVRKTLSDCVSFSRCELSRGWLLACSLLTKLAFVLHEDLTECRLGIIKVCDIMYLQEPRRENCPSKCGGGPVNVFTHRMRF